MHHVKIGRLKINLGYAFILPGILFFTLMVIYPASYVLFMSLFTEGKGLSPEIGFVGLKNFMKVFAIKDIGKILGNTVLYAGSCTFLHSALGLFFAMLLNSSSLSRRFIHTTRTAALIPWALSPTVVAIIFRLMLHPQAGPIGIALRMLNPAAVFNPLGETSTSLLVVILTNTWMFTPFYLLILLAGLQAIDGGLYEAARIDGANRPQMFFKITLPLLKNNILTLMIFDFVTTAAYFDLTWLMTQGGPVNSSEVLATLTYRTGFQAFRFGEASAMGVLIFVIAILFSTVVLRAMNGGER